MKLHQLLYFLEAARQQHVGKAARVLAISPSAVSHAISSLEEELGQPLFLKQGKNIRLNEHGKVLVERASRILRDVEQLKEEMSTESAALQGSYRLAASHLLSTLLLTPAWSRLAAGHRGLSGEIYTLRSASVLEGVASGEFDYGLCFSPRSHPRLIAERLYEGQLLLAVRRGHPVLRRKDPLQALNDFPATLPKAFHGIENCETHPVFERHGIHPAANLAYDSYEVAVAWLKATDAWGFLPDLVVRQGDLVPVAVDGWEAPVEISAVMPREGVRPRTLRRLTEELRGCLDRLRSSGPISLPVRA